jgi:subtilisin family serine protease
LIVYNIGTTAGWDRELFVAALQNIVKRELKPAVVNISVGWRHQVETKNKSADEKRAEAAVKACVEHGISVVVAMGEYSASSDLEWFPAVTEGVIAVGATDYNDLRFPDSDVGDHVWIAAPGEDILTVVNSDDFGSRSGTSFAAALVSAAVWLSVQADEDLRPAQIRQALGNSANSKRVSAGSPPDPRKGPNNNKWNDGVGCGRLDVPKFMTTVSPAAAAALSDLRAAEFVDSRAGAEREVPTMVANEKPLNTAEGVVEPRKPDTDAGISTPGMA